MWLVLLDAMPLNPDLKASHRAGRATSPALLFKGPKWLLKRSIGTLPMYLVWLFIGYVVGVLLALIAIFVVIDYVNNLGRSEKATFAEVCLFYGNYLPWIHLIRSQSFLLLASCSLWASLQRAANSSPTKAAGVGIRQAYFLPLLFLGVPILHRHVLRGGGDGLSLKAISCARSWPTVLANPVTRRSEIGKPTIRQASQGNSDGISTISAIRTPCICFRSSVPCRNPRAASGENRSTLPRSGSGYRRIVCFTTAWDGVSSTARSGPFPRMLRR